MRFDGQVAVVTGAGKGLGRAYAELLAERGAAVVVNNRPPRGDAPSTLERVVQGIRSAGGTAIANHEAMGEPGAGARVVADALDHFGRIDVVIANAGASAPRAFHHEDLDDVRATIDAHLWGTVELVHAALGAMRAQHYGRILVTSSSAALHGDAGFVAYATAKAALHGFVGSLAKEVARAGIAINAIVPFARTSMTEGLFDSGVFPEGAAEVLDVGTVAAAAVWLVSASCARNGEMWIVGGRQLRRAATVVSPGTLLDADPITPEAVAARAERVVIDGSATTYASGAELLQDIARASLSVEEQSTLDER